MSEEKTSTEVLVRLVYENGYTHDFWVKSFEINGIKWTWEAAENDKQPVMLNPSKIVAVWQIGSRNV